MKKINVILLLLLASFTSQASHLMGGDLVLKHDSVNGYYLHHTNYRDTLGIPAYQSATLIVYKWDIINTSWAIVSANATMPIDSASSFSLLTGIPYGVEVYNYYTTLGYMDTILSTNGSGTYRCIVYDCCRNAVIGNMQTPGGESLVLNCDFQYDATLSTTDNTPEFLAIPVIYGPINSAWAYNPLPYDADGDSLSWEINTPIGNVNTSNGTLDTCALYSLPPSSATGPITLNPITGEFTWTPSLLGNFVASFKIHEYRNGVEIGAVVRDMQFIVIPDSGSSGSLKMPEFATGTPYYINTTNQYNYIYYIQGFPFKFDILVSDPNASDVLSLEANSELFKPGTSNAAFNFIQTGVGNQVKGTFNWTPSANESRDKILAIRAKDGTFIKDFTILLKKLVAPTATSTIEKNFLDVQVVPNPNTGNLISFAVNSGDSYSDVSIFLYDMTGRKVASFLNLSIDLGTTFIQRRANLPKGNYMVQFITNGVNLKTMKLTQN